MSKKYSTNFVVILKFLNRSILYVTALHKSATYYINEGYKKIASVITLSDFRSGKGKFFIP